MMEFFSTEYVTLLKCEANQNECIQSDPYCPKTHGDLCQRGCFDITVDLQTMTVVDEDVKHV